MHPVISKTAQLVQAGDIAAAERALTEIAETEGDHALVAIMEDIKPKDMLAIIREFDASKESVVSMLIPPEQFADSVVLNKLYGEETYEALRGMINAVFHHGNYAIGDYIEALSEKEEGSRTMADYFEDRYAEIITFSTTGYFTPQYDHMDRGPATNLTWLMERLDDLDSGLEFGDSIANSRPVLARDEVADSDWMETAWVLRYEYPDFFEEILMALRARVDRLIAKEMAAQTQTTPAESAAAEEPEEESAI